MFWIEGLGFYSIFSFCVCGTDCMGLNLMHAGKVPCLWARFQDSIFNVLRNHLTALHTSYSILHCWKRGTQSPDLHFLLSIVFLIVMVMGVIRVVVICMFLMINEAENLFMCLLAIYTSSLKKCLLKTFARFLKSACISAHTSISFTLYDRQIQSVYKNH